MPAGLFRLTTGGKPSSRPFKRGFDHAFFIARPSRTTERPAVRQHRPRSSHARRSEGKVVATNHTLCVTQEAFRSSGRRCLRPAGVLSNTLVLVTVNALTPSLGHIGPQSSGHRPHPTPVHVDLEVTDGSGDRPPTSITKDYDSGKSGHGQEANRERPTAVCCRPRCHVRHRVLRDGLLVHLRLAMFAVNFARIDRGAQTVIGMATAPTCLSWAWVINIRPSDLVAALFQSQCDIGDDQIHAAGLGPLSGKARESQQISRSLPGFPYPLHIGMGTANFTCPTEGR